MTLIDVYDGAYFHPMNDVPKNVRAICGYVGGVGADHIWSPDDAHNVRLSGRQFWSIYVPQQKKPLTSDDGYEAAVTMLQRLPLFKQSKNYPVFFDIETWQYEADKTGASSSANTFIEKMHDNGYTQAFSYAPFEFGRDWVAKYTYSRPADLPDNIIGIQYENDRFSHPGWDASVFDSVLLGTHGTVFSSMNYTVIIRRLDDGRIFRVNLLDGTCMHLPNSAAVNACRADLDAAHIPYIMDRVNDISAYSLLP